jgi:ABC-type nitrate/sulfonate/bicarbonate transport system permease component
MRFQFFIVIKEIVSSSIIFVHVILSHNTSAEFRNMHPDFVLLMAVTTLSNRTYLLEITRPGNVKG